MKRKHMDMLVDKYDQYNNSGLGFGTWKGHQSRYEGLRTGLKRMIAKAEASGCYVPTKAYRWAEIGAPTGPNR